MWVMLPQIRQLCLPLYECIQKLFQDFHAKEVESTELLASLESIHKSFDVLVKEKTALVEQRDVGLAEAAEARDQVSAGLAAQEVLHDVRQVLLSIPGAVRGAHRPQGPTTEDDDETAETSDKFPGTGGRGVSSAFTSYMEVSPWKTYTCLAVK